MFHAYFINVFNIFISIFKPFLVIKVNSKFQITVKKEILKPETWNCSYAAPPNDIHWENLTNSRVMWYLKSGFIHGLLLILVIFLTTPKHAAEHFDDFLHLTLGKNVRENISFLSFTLLYGQNIQILLNKCRVSCQLVLNFDFNF